MTARPNGHLSGLENPVNPRQVLESLAMRLRQCPWAWPDGARNAMAARHAIRYVPSGAPLPAVGQVPLLAVNRNLTAGSVWMISWPTIQGERMGSLGGKAHEAWTLAWSALPAALPVLWTSLDAFRTPPACAIRIDRLAMMPAVTEGHDGVLDAIEGESFGLPFLLALASLALGVPLPATLVATGTVNCDGGVGCVDGVDLKTEAAVRLCGAVRKILVPNGQGDAARVGLRRAGVGSDFQVVEVRDAGAALVQAFGNDLARPCLDAVERSGDETRVVARLYDLAFRTRASTGNWNPVEVAARLARERWANRLDCLSIEKLQFVEAVAARHEGHPVELGLPSAALLAELGRRSQGPVREHLAHVVQQAADQDSPPAALVEPLAREMLADRPSWQASELKLAGALGRLLEVTGRARDGLEIERDAAMTWLDLRAPEDLPWPLSKWLWLAASLGDARAFDEALGALELALTLPGGRSLNELPYFRLAIARGEVLLGRNGAKTVRQLRTLVAGRMSDDVRPANVANHVRLSASRWLRRAAKDLGDEDSLRFAEGCLHSERLHLLDSRAADRYCALALLDDVWPDLSLALDGMEVEPPQTDRERNALRTLESGLKGRMRLLSAAAATARVPAGLYVARFHPY